MMPCVPALKSRQDSSAPRILKMHSAQGILAIYASEMRDKGMTVDEAADLLETYVGPDTIALFYLAKDRELL